MRPHDPRPKKKGSESLMRISDFKAIAAAELLCGTGNTPV